MKLEWRKKCGRKRPHPSFLLGFSSAEFKVVNNGILNKNFTKEVANFTIPAKNETLSFFLKLNKTNMPVQKVLPPLIRVDDPSILQVKIDSRFKQRGVEENSTNPNVSIEVTTNSVFMITVKFVCLSFGVTRIDFTLPMQNETSPYRDIEFSVKKVCHNDQLAVNLYDFDPTESHKNISKALEPGNIIYYEWWNHSNTPNISTETESITFWLKSLNLKNTLKFKTNVTVKGQNNSMGLVSVSPIQGEVDVGNVWGFTVFFTCINGGKFKTEVNVTVEMYKNFEFMILKNCNDWERFKRIFVYIALFITLLVIGVIQMIKFLARRKIINPK
jgi:hypothetical protein